MTNDPHHSGSDSGNNLEKRAGPLRRRDTLRICVT